MTTLLPDYLVCPVCKRPLLAPASASPEKAATELDCPRCALGFAVRNGIPVLVAERARTLSEEEVRALKPRTTEGSSR